MRWTECDTLEDLLGEREGHCAACLTVSSGTPNDGAWIVVVGGYHDCELSGTPLVAAVQHLPQLQWRALDIDLNLACDGASLTRMNDNTAYLFGGLDSEMERRDSVFAVTLKSEAEADEGLISCPFESALVLEVVQVNTYGQAPTPRCRHAAGASDGKLFIFGGETNDVEQSNDLYVLEMRTGIWRYLTGPNTFPRPTPRMQCLSLVFVSAEIFVLYGGAHMEDGDLKSLRDVWAYNTQRGKWNMIAGRQVAGALDTGDEDGVISFPKSNGHAGGRLRNAAVFLGGKNFAEGCDKVKVVYYDGAGSTDATEGESSHSTGESFRLELLQPEEHGSCPHWRYTPAVVETEKGLLLLAGQCRHPQPVSAYLLCPQ